MTLPDRPAPATGATTTAGIGPAVECSFDSITAATTRAGYAETPARLIAVVGPAHPVALTPDRYAAMTAGGESTAAAT
ncbi:hypothetical protein [Rhizohabitans arisaemae]|uniref:hypothetical protein n=1 Tax=Rhizohabitans arisaemae TaxID=2720610 RepID=UPI0024B1A905|nr:hypothetical protein [Rhizohabitans arisaemae]